jgi:hypothetical protein
LRPENVEVDDGKHDSHLLTYKPWGTSHTDTRLTAPHRPDFIPATHHDQSERRWFVIQILQGTNVLIQIWSMKKNEEAAAKRKPKTSAAQIRVQKGVHNTHILGACDVADLFQYKI